MPNNYNIGDIIVKQMEYRDNWLRSSCLQACIKAGLRPNKGKCTETGQLSASPQAPQSTIGKSIDQ